MKTYRTYSSKETKVLGAIFAERIIKFGSDKTAKTICLKGDLGAGKTTFAQGFLKALGARGRVTSPTFVLMKRFPLSNIVSKKAGLTRAYHIDAYRFRAAHESDALGLKKIFKDPRAIVIVEWPERLKSILPRTKTDIRFKHGKREQERVIIAP